MGQKQDQRTLYSISCPCGAVVSIDARGFGKPIVCRKCGKSFTVGWNKDPKGRTSPVAVTVAQKQTTPFVVVCTCGYRRPITAAESTARNRCPGCGKVMFVEKAPESKPEKGTRFVSLPSTSRTPTPVPVPALPASVAGGSEVRVIRIDPGTQTVECVCGEKILVLAQSIGQIMACPGCSRKLRVERKESSSSTWPRVTLPGSKYPTPPPGLFCRCGQGVDIAQAMTSKGAICSACGETITMEKVRTSNKNTIVRPRFGPKPPPPPPVAPPPPPAPALPEALELPMADFKEPAAAPYAPRDTSNQAVFCPCGEALTVGPDDVGKNIQCPTCLILIAVDRVRDMAGNSVLRVRAIGKMDEGDTWSLSDFK